MGKLTDGVITLKSRSYQAVLEEIAIAKNTIIHLPTGSGKTFIALRLIKKFRAALQKPWGEGGKRTFFLVNTVPLVNQQKKVIKALCPVDGVAGYCGEDGVDYWDKNKWDMELSEHQVVVMTCQILCDMLTHTYIKIEDINLLIFDECHHAVENHPMRLIMKHFESCPVEKQPRVLGLTATLLNANVTTVKVQDVLKELEVTFHATIATVNEMGEVLSYSTNPYEVIEVYRHTETRPAAQEAIDILTELQDIVMTFKLKTMQEHNIKLKPWQKDITNDPKKVIKEIKNSIQSMILFINDLGEYGGALGILAYMIVFERFKRKAVTEDQQTLYEYIITSLTEARMVLLDLMENESGYDKIVKYSSEKVLKLLDILKEYNPKRFNKPGVLLKVNKQKKELSSIIFTQQRFTAKVLYNLLNDVCQANQEEFGFLKHDFIVGMNANPMKATREQQYVKKTNMKALLKFKNHELNCLIATSVIEEGVDIPQCLLVLRYDRPLEYRSYIQSKGRARSSDSSFVILVDGNEHPKFVQLYQQFQRTESHIQHILVGKFDERVAPTEEDIQENLYDENDIPPYVTPHGVRLSALSAISLLNRYCMTLPHDQFTVITPVWIKEDVKDGVMVTITMPIACPVKEEIKGNPMPSLKSAKRSAAMNACIKLHEVGELDLITLLPRQYTAVDFDEDSVKSCFPNWPTGQKEPKDLPKPGSKKRLRKTRLMFPRHLDSVNTKSNQQAFCLHVIELKANFAKPNEPRERALYDFLQRSEGYGFLTRKPLPKLCDFPVFLTVGEVKASIKVNYAVIELDKPLLDLVKRFHYFIFDQVLAVAKKFVVHEGKVNCMYVVPVTESNGYDIDWTLMQEHDFIPPVTVPTLKERKSLKISKEKYLNCVVTPWYRGIILPDRYIVSNVLEYMTPSSQFDSDAYCTYKDYYSSKYNLEVMGDKDQPLLEVRNISTRMNCLLPRAATINEFSEKQKKLISASQGDDRAKFVEIFVAEFCTRYDYPGVLWYKATMLPSIVHRVYMLLVADELREQIVRETNYGLPVLTQSDTWQPIQINQHIVIKSLLSHVEEPTPVNTVDRINNAMDVDQGLRSKPLSMEDSLYQIQKKKLDEEYPWDEKMEPLDIERNISTVTVMDIECYDKFVTAPVVDVDRSPVQAPFNLINLSTALSAPPLKYNDNIEILKKTPNNIGPELKDMLAALTTINSHDTFDLERAETLGDSFLKFSASLYLYHKFPQRTEGQLTNIKGKLISNRNLYYAGERFNLAGRMKVEPFAPRKDFLVPGFFAPKEVEDYIVKNKIRPTFLIGVQFDREEALSGHLNEESKAMLGQRYADREGEEAEPEGKAQNSMQSYIHSQVVSDKSVADCVEALIGTYLLSGGILAAVKLVEWMKILPPEDNFAELLHKPVPTVLKNGEATETEINFLLENCAPDIERILGYKFKDPSLLLEALSHASYIRNRLTRSYERLEFLGDAILDFLITSYIFENCVDLKPGDITDLRSALVNNVTFAAYVVKLELHKFMCCELNPSLEKVVMTFAEHQIQRNHSIVEDVLYLIDEEECQVAQYVEVPKVLSDIFESLAGAIYLDSGGDLEAVWKVYYRIMRHELDSFSRCIPRQPVRLLYEMIHACPVFGDAKVVDPDIPKVSISVTFTKDDRQHRVYGIGKNKFQAKRAAAKLALKILNL